MLGHSSTLTGRQNLSIGRMLLRFEDGTYCILNLSCSCMMATSTSISKMFVLIVSSCLLPANPTQGFSLQQVWECCDTEHPGMVASQCPIYLWLSTMPDPGRAHQILSSQHNSDSQSQQSGHLSYVCVRCGLSAWPTVHRWGESWLRLSAEPPVSSTWILSSATLMVTLIIFVSLVGFLFLRYTVVCYHTSDSYLPDYLVCRTLEFVLNFLTFHFPTGQYSGLRWPAASLSPVLLSLRAMEETAETTKSGPVLLSCRLICLAVLDTGLCPKNQELTAPTEWNDGALSRVFSAAEVAVSQATEEEVQEPSAAASMQGSISQATTTLKWKWKGSFSAANCPVKKKGPP